MATDLIGTAAAAEILGISRRTVKRLALVGELPYVLKMDGTGPYLFDRNTIEALAAQRNELAS